MTTPGVDITSVLQTGLLGVIFLCLVFRKWIVPEWTLKKAEEQATADRDDLTRRAAAEHEEMTRRLETAQAQLAALQNLIAAEMIPALTKATDINSRYTEELQYLRFTGGARPAPPSVERR